MLVHIEKAIISDIPSLTSLLFQLFSKEAEFTPDITAQEQSLRMIINNPQSGVILTAKHNGQTIGMVNLLFTVSTALGGKVILLEDMIISEQYRSQGIGSKLLAEAIAFANREGFKRITLLTDLTNEIGQQFYSSHGFTKSTMVPMRLLLG
ncbi:GNAT family N-acetyltransferase [Thiomicrorhabdus cannonii]|uniref:GNAT family N-acetyltransferase n=1 Tax=Thiomicrorhabdus cannonii TaxID=2748011 RepID=UPI0015BF5E28|nr:GNAT family N-acetyltransferase [Thiomicrorhabdus cannonii]